MERNAEAQTAPIRYAVVRAIPMPGHSRRWCGHEPWVIDRGEPAKGLAPTRFGERHGLPWTASETKVAIVANPKPFDPSMGPPREISPATLVMLERDDRMSVRVLNGEGGGDPAEVYRAKAAIAEFEEDLAAAGREIATLSESLHLERNAIAAERESTKAAANEAGARYAVLEQELAAARAQLAAARSAPPEAVTQLPAKPAPAPAPKK